MTHDVEAGLAAKLSTIAAVYPLSLPEKQGIYPAIVYQRISTSSYARTHTGDKKQRPRFQFSIYAKSYGSCRTAADALDTLMDGKSDGTNGIDLAFNDNRFDIKEVETGLFRVVLEYLIWQS